jgi:site-specific DNA recombinase
MWDQVLLLEEFARHGWTWSSRAPRAETPEDVLLLQFQGMIAEYEKAQISERTRRGKRHRAQAGFVNALTGAPFGYCYVRKAEGAPARYEVVERARGGRCPAGTPTKGTRWAPSPAG